MALNSYFCKLKEKMMTECKCEKVLPYDNQRGKTEQVEQMFDNIAGDYDPMNRMMSLFNDRDWRKKALLTLTKYQPQRMLDIATGTRRFCHQRLRTAGTERDNRHRPVGKNAGSGPQESGSEEPFQNHHTGAGRFHAPQV
jgi:hypothetical protein